MITPTTPPHPTPSHPTKPHPQPRAKRRSATADLIAWHHVGVQVPERSLSIALPTPPHTHPTHPATCDVSKQSELQVSDFRNRKWDIGDASQTELEVSAFPSGKWYVCPFTYKTSYHYNATNIVWKNPVEASSDLEYLLVSHGRLRKRYFKKRMLMIAGLSPSKSLQGTWKIFACKLSYAAPWPSTTQARIYIYYIYIYAYLLHIYICIEEHDL